MKIIYALAISAAIGLSGCASPDVVEKSKLSDSSLSCAQITYEINECDRARREATKEKGLTGTNVAAVVFFWPGLIATHMNVNDAVKALDERKAHLVKLFDEKRCK